MNKFLSFSILLNCIACGDNPSTTQPSASDGGVPDSSDSSDSGVDGGSTGGDGGDGSTGSATDPEAPGTGNLTYGCFDENATFHPNPIAPY